MDLTDQEYNRIERDCIESWTAAMIIQDYFDAVMASPISEAALLQAIRNRDEPEIGNVMIKAGDLYIRRLAQPDIEEKVLEREQELRRAS